MMDFRTLDCFLCKKSSIIPLETEKVNAWISGKYVQDVWPEKSAPERERIKTGIHPECWDKIFAEEDGEC